MYRRFNFCLFIAFTINFKIVFLSVSILYKNNAYSSASSVLLGSLNFLLKLKFRSQEMLLSSSNVNVMKHFSLFFY